MADVLAPLMLLPRVITALEESDQAITAVSLGAKRHAARVGDQILTAAAHASANLDEDPDLGLAAAAIESVDSLPKLSVAPLQAIAQLHAVVAIAEDPDSRGRPRSEFAEGDRLTALSDVALSSSPAVLVGAILHGELLAMAPFATRNGLVARGTYRAILTQRGVDPLISVEIGLGDFGGKVIASALDSYKTGTAEGVSAWVELNARAITFAAKALSEAINSK